MGSNEQIKVHRFLFCFILLAVSTAAAGAQTLEFDHVWLVVSKNAPERAALEQAGFTVSPGLNEHKGQGTASVTIDFDNAFLELLWPDADVAIEPGYERAREKFQQRMLWRTSGWCPIGIGMRRTDASNAPLPLSNTWSISPEWMLPGTAIEILTPRDDKTSPSLFISPPDLSAKDKEANRNSSGAAAKSKHMIGVKQVTDIRLISPRKYRRIEALKYVQNAGIMSLDRGSEWAIEITFDNRRKKKKKDFRPGLPLIIKY